MARPRKRKKMQGPVRVRSFSYRNKDGKVIHVKGFRRAAPGGAKRRIIK